MSASSKAEESAPEDTKIRMYLLVNTDLGMGKGKIAAQAAHGAVNIVLMLEKLRNPPATYTRWLATGTTKIALKATEAQMREIHKKYSGSYLCDMVIDAGCTQIAPGSFTVLAFAPLRPTEVPPEISALKLL
jgi:PTH2 family peptidyl-tRNA hydrolase